MLLSCFDVKHTLPKSTSEDVSDWNYFHTRQVGCNSLFEWITKFILGRRRDRNGWTYQCIFKVRIITFLWLSIHQLFLSFLFLIIKENCGSDLEILVPYDLKESLKYINMPLHFHRSWKISIVINQRAQDFLSGKIMQTFLMRGLFLG